MKQLIFSCLLYVVLLSGCRPIPEIIYNDNIQEIFEINTARPSNCVVLNNTLYFYTVDTAKNWRLWSCNSSNSPEIRVTILNDKLSATGIQQLFVLDGKLYMLNGYSIFSYTTADCLSRIGIFNQREPEYSEYMENHQDNPYFAGIRYMYIEDIAFLINNNSIYIQVNKCFDDLEMCSGELNIASLWIFNSDIGLARLFTQYMYDCSLPVIVGYTDKIYIFPNYCIRKLWIYDKSLNKTEKSIAYIDFKSEPLVYDDFLYFASETTEKGTELWGFDRLNPPFLVKDLNQGAGSSNPGSFTEYGDKLYFTADDEINERKVWVYDKTGNLEMLDDLFNGNISYSNPDYLRVHNGKLYFTTGDDNTGHQLWSYDEYNASFSISELTVTDSSHFIDFTSC